MEKSTKLQPAASAVGSLNSKWEPGKNSNIWIVPSEAQSQPQQQQLIGQRFLTLNTIARVRQIEVTRDTAQGPDESIVHTTAEAKTFREAIETAWPGARITWAFSWLALHDERPQYHELRALIVSYQKRFPR